MTTPPLNTAPPSFRLDDRLIVVTGSAEGIGRAFAEGFAQSGAHVVLASRRREKLEEVQQAITTRGGRADVVQTDLTRLADIAALGAVVRKLAQGNERRIVLVNNAGYGFTKAAIEVTEADWNSVFDVHVKGAFFCAQQLAPLMIERGYGKIINMSSTWSALTDVGKSAYCAAKAAVSHLTAQLATEWASAGIRVNAIAPGTTMTEFVQKAAAANPARYEKLLGKIKLGRYETPADLLGAAIFLASGASDFVTGQTLYVDGGVTC